MNRARLIPILSLLVCSQVLAQEWIAYTSDNFTLYSDADEEDALEILRNFESFRGATLRVLNLPDNPETERLLIMAYDRGRDYNRIVFGSNVSGFFYHSVFGPRMIIGPGGDSDDTQGVLFHEYVHHLMNQHANLNFPRWYAEGFANLLAPAEINDTTIVIGKAPPNYLRSIGLGFDTTVHQVIDMKFDGMSGAFYLTSWLLTHYLVLDAENAPLRRNALLEYLARYDAGEDSIEAFRTSFQMTPSEMQSELQRYARRRTFTAITMQRPPYTGELTRRVLSDGEDWYRLGDIAVERDEFEAAHYYFDMFDESHPDSDFKPKVDSRRAIVYAHEEDFEAGDKLIEPLIAAGSSDADVLADIAHYEFDRFVYETEQSSGAANFHLDRAIAFGERTIAANPEDVEALYYLGLSYNAAGELQAAADTLFSSHDINPSSARLNFALIGVMLKGRQPEVASYLVSRLYSASHSDGERERLAELQEAIDNNDTEFFEELGL